MALGEERVSAARVVRTPVCEGGCAACWGRAGSRACKHNHQYEPLGQLISNCVRAGPPTTFDDEEQGAYQIAPRCGAWARRVWTHITLLY